VTLFDAKRDLSRQLEKRQEKTMMVNRDAAYVSYQIDNILDEMDELSHLKTSLEEEV